MPDPLLALILVFAFLVATSLASSFKTLDSTLLREAPIPIVAGVLAGVPINVAGFAPRFAVAGIVLTAAALYVRLTGRESEPSSGMLLGAITGAAAALPHIISADDELLALAELILAGAVAGFGITFGLTHVQNKMRQAVVDATTAFLAIGAAWLPSLALRFPRITDRHVAIAAAGFIPLLVIATVFKQWPSIRAELQHEAALGVIDAEDVRSTAHPLLRLGRAGWYDSAAHREFVRIANRIALRKLQQRSRREEVARLYQLEVIKLRMQLQQMASIDRAMRAQSLGQQEAAG